MKDDPTTTPTATIRNPNPLNAPGAPGFGVTRGTTADDIAQMEANRAGETVPSKPTEELTAADFGLVPGGPKLHGNTDSLKHQDDDRVREKYDEARKQTLADNDQSENGRLRRRVAELEKAVSGRSQDDVPPRKVSPSDAKAHGR